MDMAIPMLWKCTKCGRKTMASTKPGTGNTSYGKCPKGGEHRWTKGN